MFSGISLDQAPPIKIPFRMFLSAPIFGILASILLLFSDSQMNRFSPQIITIAHFLFAGFAGFVMIGAIYQMLPVVIGVIFKSQEKISKLVFMLLVLGLLLFAINFLTNIQITGLTSSVFLFFGFVLFGLFSLFSIGNKITSSASSLGIFAAIFVLISVASLGGYLLSSNSMGNFSSNYYDFANLHIFLAFFGWAFLLILAISYQVVPMFWITKSYPKWIIKFFAYIVFGDIFLFAGSIFLQSKLLEIFAILVFVLFTSYFAFVTLQRLSARKRKRFDIVVLCWQISALFLVCGDLLTTLSFFIDFDLQIQMAIFFGVGFVLTLIIGMLYKIVPFLVWFHLNAKGIFDAPMMNEMINEKLQKIQIASHVLAVFLLVCGFAFELDLLLKMGGLSLAISFILLQINLIKSYKIWLSYV